MKGDSLALKMFGVEVLPAASLSLAEVLPLQKPQYLVPCHM